MDYIVYLCIGSRYNDGRHKFLQKFFIDYEYN